MAGSWQDYLDEQVEKVEKKVVKIYKQAEKETNAKLKQYMADFKRKDTVKKALLKKGEISQAEYDQWRTGQLMIGKRWEDMRDTLAQDFTNANAIARSIAISYMPDAYAMCHNYSTFLIEKGSKLDTGYALYNRATVERLIRDDPALLPPPGKTMQTKIALGEAKKWQKSKVQSVFAQALLQGESVDNTAKRIANNLSTQNMQSAVRYARTALTGAQNAGNVDAYMRAKRMGIKTKKMWVATLDGRTRHDHRMLDGQTRDLEDPFKNDLGEIMFPGDPSANPANIWNCRCTIIPQIEGFEKDIKDLGLRNDEKLGGMSYDEWRFKKAKEPDAAKINADLYQMRYDLLKFPIKTYSGIWRTDVNTTNYPDKKDSIQAKRDYFNQQIDRANRTGQYTDKIPQWEQYLKDLDEFEREGQKYLDLVNSIDDAEKALRDLKRKAVASGAVQNDMFSQARKDAAKWFTPQNGGFRAADSYFDPLVHDTFRSATRAEERGFYRYTEGSGGHNRPLAGYQKPWSKSGTGWEEEFYVGPEKVWIDFEGKGDDIRSLTTLIEKSKFTDDVWLQSGQGFSTLEGSLGMKRNTLQYMSNAELENTLVGRRFEAPQFISTAVNKGGGACFNSKPTKWNIYCPAGSEGLYASDQGAFGKGENELILQRGGTYEITRAYWGTDPTDNNRRKLFVDLELHSELGYNKFQQDPNEWKGSRKNYRNS